MYIDIGDTLKHLLRAKQHARSPMRRYSTKNHAALWQPLFFNSSQTQREGEVTQQHPFFFLALAFFFDDGFFAGGFAGGGAASSGAGSAS